jgi:hypothetical protein
MARNVLQKARSFLIRGLAVVAVVGTYVLGNLGAQIATTLGISTLALTTTSTPADAGWGWRRRGWGYRRWRRWRRW